MCKTLPRVGIRLAVWSLKSAALILHVGRQHLPAGQICRERQTRVSMLILDGPLNIDRASNKAFPRQFYLPEPETFCSSFELQCFCKLFFLSELFMNLFLKIAAVVQLLGTTDIFDWGTSRCLNLFTFLSSQGANKIKFVFVDRSRLAGDDEPSQCFPPWKRKGWEREGWRKKVLHQELTAVLPADACRITRIERSHGFSKSQTINSPRFGSVLNAQTVRSAGL